MGGKRNPEALTPDALFDLLCEYAVAGKRCPENYTHGLNSQNVSALCRDGRIRSEVSGQNYRQVHILTGPHKGKATLPPAGGQKPWRIVGRETTVNGWPVDSQRTREPRKSKPEPRAAASAPVQRAQPSAPRPLPADYFKD